MTGSTEDGRDGAGRPDLRDGTPFVLLDDSRPAGAPARLFYAPSAIISANGPGEIADALERVRAATRQGNYVAGFLGYDAGLAFEPRLRALERDRAASDLPDLWFGIFDRVERIAPGDVPGMLPDPQGAWAGPIVRRIDRATYGAAFDRVADYIRAGDIYQANLSLRADVTVSGHPLALYARLRASSSAGWGGVLFTGDHWILSASPELFFTREGARITARPMKGTAPRAYDPAADAASAARLAADPKERAENLMIVDLLRNDLSRVAQPGSVRVPDLFTVETYPTLHTLTSTVVADSLPDTDAVSTLAALFPCGSITGAPKMRAMEIIREVEPDRRGLYTGSIGWIGPDDDAAFNVAIRTVTMPVDAQTATLGLGSAVVADSAADAEWRECLLKARFVTRTDQAFDLIETLRFDPEGGIAWREAHLARLTTSARTLGFAVPSDLVDRLDRATASLSEPARIRLALSPDATVAITIAPVPAPAPGPATVAIVPLPVDPTDFRLRHKTSDRHFYDEARDASGCFEVVFVDPAGHLTEGSFTSLFVPRDGRLLTPPLSRGLLPGILRGQLLAEGRAVEADLRADDLRDGLLIGNALRGLMPAVLR